MSSGSVATAPPTRTSPGPSESPPRKYRVPLSKIQTLAAQGKAKLSPNEIQLFQQRGFLRSETASQALATIKESTPSATTTEAASSPATAPSQGSASPPSHNLQPTERSPAATHEPFRTIGSSHQKAAPKEVSASNDADCSEQSPRKEQRSGSIGKQIHPPFHNHIFEDTCSHLHPSQADLAVRTPGLSSMDISTSFRRHSECSTVINVRPSVRSASVSTLSSYSTLTSSRLSRTSFSGKATSSSPSSSSNHHRRPSRLSSAAPVVSSSEGFRTVLYAASPSLTLYSLPTTMDEAALAIVTTANTTASMASFKFPATTTPPPTHNTQSSPLLNASSPTLGPTPLFNTTASSPLMSPRSKRKQSIPMRSPSLTDSQDLSPGVIFQFPFGNPSYSVRSARSPSSPLAGSDDGHGINGGRSTPPSHYPSPASSIRHLEHNHYGHHSGSGDLFAGQATPASPLTRSGLGIRVHEESEDLEPGAVPHPLDQRRSSSTLTLGSKAIASLDELSSISMEIDPPSATPPSVQSRDIPTPPSSALVQATQRMEVPARLHREQGAGATSKASPSPSLLSLPPATPSANALDTPMSEKGLAEVDASSGDHNGKEQAENEDDEDTASLPLWAQRQLSIRRQSLIPRNELDFVTGTGILPPPSTDLVIHGGARIKAYPPLLSDIVKVQREELLQEEAARHAEEEAEMAASAANNGKRRKASSAGQGKGGRGSFSAQGAHHEDDSEDTLGQLGQHQDQVDMGSVRTRRSSHAAQGTADEAHSSVKDGSERPTGARYNRRRTYGADDNEAYYPSGSSPTMGHGDESRSYHSTTRPMRLDSPAELSIDMLDESTAPGRPISKGKNKHGKTIRQTVGAPSSGYHNEDPREHSWDESRDTDMDRHRHQFYHHQGEHLDEESHATMRRASIHGLQEKGKVVKKTLVKSTLPKKVDLRASFGDMNEIEEEGEYGRRHSFQQIREHSQGGYGVMPAASPEADMARQCSDHGFGAFRTLQPLLNATQYDDHRGNQSMDNGSGERRFLLPPMGATRGYGNNQMVIPRVNDKKVKYNGAVVAPAGTKGSKKAGAAHMGGHPGDAKRGRNSKAGEARRSILYGPSAESLAMAEALMEMHHDGAVDDHDEDEDATEDEYVPHRSAGADYAYSDSQDESHATMRPSNVKKVSAQKRKLSAKMSTPTGATSGFGTMSPQPKKKKVANPDSAKSKKQAKDQGASTSSAGRQGGSSSSFDSTGQRVSSLGSGSSSKHCEACGAKETPCWRPGYIPNTVLCNSCGLRYKKSNVFCTKVTCKYIPLKTEYANMEADRLENRRDHLICIQCKGRVALPIPKEEA